jgi:hypothetical protein
MPADPAEGLNMQRRMPLATDDAALVHRLVPGAPSQADGTGTALACPVSGQACPALAAVFGRLEPASDTARGWVMALAPCAQCRVASESRRAALRHVRLGQREREILCAASATEVLVLTQPGMPRSASAARRRAALSLGKAGLVAPVAPSGATHGPVRGPARAAVALTDLGRYVMAAYGRYVTAGKPVRWTRPLKGVAIPGQDPALLAGAALARSETALRDTLSELKGVLVAAVAGRFKDPERLDAVARHLEEKAKLLRDALGPARPDGAR